MQNINNLLKYLFPSFCHSSTNVHKVKCNRTEALNCWNMSFPNNLTCCFAFFQMKQ